MSHPATNHYPPPSVLTTISPDTLTNPGSLSRYQPYSNNTSTEFKTLVPDLPSLDSYPHILLPPDRLPRQTRHPITHYPQNSIKRRIIFASFGTTFVILGILAVWGALALRRNVVVVEAVWVDSANWSNRTLLRNGTSARMVVTAIETKGVTVRIVVPASRIVVVTKTQTAWALGSSKARIASAAASTAAVTNASDSLTTSSLPISSSSTPVDGLFSVPSSVLSPPPHSSPSSSRLPAPAPPAPTSMTTRKTPNASTKYLRPPERTIGSFAGGTF